MNLFNTLLKSILFFSTLFPLTILANNDTPLLIHPEYSIGLDLGVGRPTNLGNTTTFPLGYSTFYYSSNNKNLNPLISGVSISKVLTINSLCTLQVGVSVHYISTMGVNGNLEQGISIPYYQSTYSYSI